MSLWHRITEADPAPLEDVLIAIDDGSEMTVWMAWRSHSDPRRWMYSGSDEEVYGAPAYWMPLPLPPTPVQEEVGHARGPDRA